MRHPNARPCRLDCSRDTSIQAGIGNVVAGSAFATAQTVAMGGAIPNIVTAAGACIGAAAGAACPSRMRMAAGQQRWQARGTGSAGQCGNSNK